MRQGSLIMESSMSSHIRHRISIETLENGFEVELPDVVAIKKAEAESKKKGNGSFPFTGDLTKKFAAKSMGEVIKLITGALKSIPEREFEDAFEEAGSK